jgi:hypothetical protein
MGKKWYLSKTINFNAIYLAMIAVITEGFGIALDPTIVAGGQALMNLILRKYFTREPIA